MSDVECKNIYIFREKDGLVLEFFTESGNMAGIKIDDVVKAMKHPFTKKTFLEWVGEQETYLTDPGWWLGMTEEERKAIIEREP